MEDGTFLPRLIFSDEATFNLSGKVNRHNVRIWGLQNPQEALEHERDSPKVNVFCALQQTKVYGPFFFAENTKWQFLILCTAFSSHGIYLHKPRTPGY
jgi:hypothetical protein